MTVKKELNLNQKEEIVRKNNITRMITMSEQKNQVAKIKVGSTYCEDGILFTVEEIHTDYCVVSLNNSSKQKFTFSEMENLFL
jgi:riboflavin synthase alpha subunit